MTQERHNTQSETRHHDLGDFEQADSSRPPYFLTVPELKLLGIAGVCGMHYFL